MQTRETCGFQRTAAAVKRLSLSRMHYLSSDEAHLSLTCGYFDPKRKKKKKENTPRSTYMYLSVNDSENKQTNKNKM